MGITGLIPFLEKASRQVDLEELSGSTVAIDAYCWLHKGVIGCAEKLMKGEKTNIHIQYCLRQVNYLVTRRIRPILVFDGRHLAAKAGVEAERRESRKAAKEKAKDLIAAGKHSEARSYLQRALNISHKMALELIDACHDRGIDCIVAPYEADGQLAYLNLSGIAEYVITEDSDLLLFGCTKVLFKFSQNGGLLIEADKLHLAMGLRKEKYTFNKFRHMCILSGCDYLPSLPGIGLAKAKKFLLLTEETDMKRALGKIPSYLGMRQIVVTDEYKEGFLKAEATFKYMIVYDPKDRKLTRLNTLEAGIDESLLANSGEFFDEEIAYQLALGNIDPMSMKTVHDWDPDEQLPEKHRALSIWGSNKENGNKKHKGSLPPTEDEIHAEHMKSIKLNLFSKIEENDIQIQAEDLVSMYYVQDLNEPPKKKIRTSPRKSNNIFKAKPKEHKTPVKSPLKSPNECNVSLIGAVSTKTRLLDTLDEGSRSKPLENSSKKDMTTPQKDIFAIAKQKTDEIISPAALKLLHMVQEKLKQPKPRRIRVSIATESKSSLNESPKYDNDNDPVLNESIETLEDSNNQESTPVMIEPSIILIEDDSPMKFTPTPPLVKPKIQVKATPTSRPSGLTKRKKSIKQDSGQTRLSHFGFNVNKKI